MVRTWGCWCTGHLPVRSESCPPGLTLPGALARSFAACSAGARALGRASASAPIFFFNDTATTEIYTLSLHDALPICNTLIFTFAAPTGKDFNAGSQATILVPAGWTAPTSGNVIVTTGPAPASTVATLGTIAGTGPWTDRKSTRLNSIH